MFLPFFYECALWILSLVALPKLFYQRWKHNKYKQSLNKRLGSDFPYIQKGDRPLVWIHGVSVGETKAVAPLAKIIKESIDNPILVIASTTETGHAEAMRSLPFADYHVYQPLDFRYIVEPIMAQVKPDLVILAETDFWYNFLRFAKKNGAQIAVVNGKISERSMGRLHTFSFFAKALFTLIDLFCVQNELYKQRFQTLGVPSDKLIVTGNIKFDEDYPKLTADELAHWRDLLGIKPEDKVLVAGSTHDPEETILLDALQTVWKTHPELKVVIVPRHPERFTTVGNLLAQRNISFIRFSGINSKTGRESVILIDAMGVLRKCYQLADIALVGGSYTPKVGGHNIMEPCWFGVPVLFGPHMKTQPELVDLMNQYQAGLQVPQEQLAAVILEYLDDSEKRNAMGQRGVNLVSDLKGATSRTWEAVRNIIDCHK